MDQIRVKDFRCFHEEQTARLAPLTLLVGENSTGKTSFMALVRVLWDMGYFRILSPNFKEEPYDLGSFDEIAHHRGSRGGRADEFDAGFTSSPAPLRQVRRNRLAENQFKFSVTFARKGTVPIPTRRYTAQGKIWVEEHFKTGNILSASIGTSRGAWRWHSTEKSRLFSDFDFFRGLLPFEILHDIENPIGGNRNTPQISRIDGSPALSKSDYEELQSFAYPDVPMSRNQERRPFASAPVRSKPRRTYDPALHTRDPVGDNIPMYLANTYFHDRRQWPVLKDALEKFGRASGLFNELSIKPLGKRDTEPFQIQVRKAGGSAKGPPRNLIDVGYGVSQVLPIIIELLGSRAPPMFLLQQPEVHLHPSAQAALATLFCQVASPQCQLVIETHSDYLLDRVRMEVRDGSLSLQPDDVSILYFERDKLEVRIHSLRLDELGNILGAPEGYRRFFLEETRRSFGL